MLRCLQRLCPNRASLPTLSQSQHQRNQAHAAAALRSKKAAASLPPSICCASGAASAGDVLRATCTFPIFMKTLQSITERRALPPPLTHLAHMCNLAPPQGPPLGLPLLVLPLLHRCLPPLRLRQLRTLALRLSDTCMPRAPIAPPHLSLTTLPPHPRRGSFLLFPLRGGWPLRYEEALVFVPLFLTLQEAIVTMPPRRVPATSRSVRPQPRIAMARSRPLHTTAGRAPSLDPPSPPYMYSKGPPPRGAA